MQVLFIVLLFLNCELVHSSIIVDLSGIENTIGKALVVHTVGHALCFKADSVLLSLRISSLTYTY